MKITDVQAVYPRYQNMPPSWRTHFWQIVVRVETDAGVTGFGYGGGGVASVEIINGHLRDLLLDRPLNSTADIATVWDLLYEASIPYGRKGLAIMALSGVDLALWDALAKAENKPVCDLLSGKRRDRVRAYASGADVAWYRDLGFTGTKTPHRWTGDESAYDDLSHWAESARLALGNDALLMIDTYMSWDTAVTIEMARRLAGYRIYWFEDVLTPDHLQEQAALCRVIKPVLLAGGEHEFTHFGFGDVARARALDLWQPDVTWCGGITATLRILELAKANGVPVVLHRGGEPWGLHIIAAGLCEDLAELVVGRRNATQDRLWLGAPEPDDGRLTVSSGPGFGVQVNEDML